MLVALLVIWVSVLFLWYFQNRRRFFKMVSAIPQPPSYPLIGHAHYVLQNPEKTFAIIRDACIDYHRMVGLSLGPIFVVFMFDPGDIETILKNTKQVKKANEYRFLRPWLGDGVLLSTGNKFKRHKRLIMKSMHMNILKESVEVFSRHAARLVERLEENVDKGEFDIHPYLNSTTINTFLESSLSINEDEANKFTATYAHAVEKLGRLAHIRVYKVWFHLDTLFRFSKIKKEQDKYIKIINDVTDGIIKEREKNLQNTEEKQTFLDNLLLEKDATGERVISNEEIRDEVNTLLFAGLDTTTVSLGFALSLLGIYTDIQDKVVSELNDVFGDSNRPVTFEDLQNLNYLEQVIKETWRMYPPIPFIGRKPTDDLKLDGDVTIPKNCAIIIMLLGLHRNPRYYPHPHRFNPDNFSPENIKKRHPYSFIPFSAGQRTCFGKTYSMMVIKVVLATLLRTYKVTATTKERDFCLAAQTTLKRKGGFKIAVRQRN